MVWGLVVRFGLEFSGPLRFVGISGPMKLEISGPEISGPVKSEN